MGERNWRGSRLALCYGRKDGGCDGGSNGTVPEVVLQIRRCPAAQAGLVQMHASSGGEGIINQAPERFLVTVFPGNAPQAVKKPLQFINCAAKTLGKRLQPLLNAALLSRCCEKGSAIPYSVAVKVNGLLLAGQAPAQVWQQSIHGCLPGRGGQLPCCHSCCCRVCRCHPGGR